MKNIVLYAIAFLLMTLPDAKGQKPVIDLLPSTHHMVHPEAVIDSSHGEDTLIPVPPVAGQHVNGPENHITGSEKNVTGSEMDPPKEKIRKTSPVAGPWSITGTILQRLLLNRIILIRTIPFI